MDIIKLPVKDWREYRQLRLRALKEDPEAFSSSYADDLNRPDEIWQQRVAAATQGDRSWLLFARQNNQLVGMIGAFLEGESAEVATVVSMYVPKEARRRGISLRLMDELLRILSGRPDLKKAELRVNATQRPAIQLYKRFGFRQTGSQPSTTGAGQVVQQIMMERDLPVRNSL